jgi:Mn2+/Fe2+ NRAMP family transporter
MSLDKAFNILGMIIVLAIVTTIVAHRNTARVVTATASGLANVIRAAMGQGTTSPVRRR